VRQEGLRDERQDQHLDDGEDTTSDDTSTGTCGRARMAPPSAIAARNAADRNARRERRRPFALKPNHLRAM
jgi:hypothetical protein